MLLIGLSIICIMKFYSVSLFCVFLVALLQCQHSTAIDPDYTLINRLSQVIQATGNTFNQIFDINQLPIEQKVTFWCATPARKSYLQVYLDDSSLGTKINLTLPMAFIIHGWTDNCNRTWALNMVNDYVSNVDTNVCFVDWSPMALMEYALATENTYVVADYLHQFINYLGTQGFSLDKITLVGHSMGAQICGITGAKFNGEIPVIIGLDPAGWGYTKPLDAGASLRLDKTDAKYVQCVHTDGNGLGTQLDCGHQDFYSMDGNSPQPGCLIPVLQNGMTYAQFTCSHFKSVEFFRSTLSGHDFKAKQCLSYLWWSLSFCNLNQQDNLGLNGKRIPISADFFFKPLILFPYV